MADSAPQRSADDPQGRPGILMGRPFGIPVYVSPTWFLIAAVITWGYAPIVQRELPDIGSARYLVAFTFVVLLYLSVLIHELSHSVVARRFGLPVRRITLYMLGGVSEIEQEPQTPGREFAVAFAGPLLSLVLGVGCYVLYLALPGTGVVAVLVYEVALANLLVGGFNLLPGLPLDGGRILRAGVWGLTRRPATATVVAGWIGRGLAVAVLTLPIGSAALSGAASWPTVIWMAFIASFIWLGAGQSIRGAKLKERLPWLRARTLARRAVPVTADVPLSEAIRRANLAQAGAIVVVDHEGRPIALVNESAVLATPDARRPWIQVGSVARTLEPGLVLSADLEGEQLVEAMRRIPASEYLLVEPGGQVYGVLAAADVDRMFAGV